MTRRRFAYAGLAIIAIPVVLYLALLSLQAYSAWQASRTLDRLEALRIGDPAAKYGEAVKMCKNEFGVCALTAGAYRPHLLYAEWLWKLSPELADRFSYFVNHVGLRYWRLTTSCKVEENRIASVSTGLILVGRYEMLGAAWVLEPTVPADYLRHNQDKNVPSYIGWFHITSDPSGEGYRVITTNRSPIEDLYARRINRRCLASFFGCTSLHQLLPDAAPLLRRQDIAPQ